MICVKILKPAVECAVLCSLFQLRPWFRLLAKEVNGLKVLLSQDLTRSILMRKGIGQVLKKSLLHCIYWELWTHTFGHYRVEYCHTWMLLMMPFTSGRHDTVWRCSWSAGLPSTCWSADYQSVMINLDDLYLLSPGRREGSNAGKFVSWTKRCPAEGAKKCVVEKERSKEAYEEWTTGGESFWCHISKCGGLHAVTKAQLNCLVQGEQVMVWNVGGRGGEALCRAGLND